jgi:hypothetical protein
MTDEPQADDPHAEESGEEPSRGKGSGCFIGGLATVGSILAGLLVGGIITGVLGAAGAVLTPIIAIGLLIFVGFSKRETPGFLLGMGLTIAISLAIGTGCTAYFMGPSSPFG